MTKPKRHTYILCMYVCMYVCVGLLLPSCNGHSHRQSNLPKLNQDGTVQLQGGALKTVTLNFSKPGFVAAQVNIVEGLYDVTTSCTTGNVDWELCDGTIQLGKDITTDNPNIYKKLNLTATKNYNLKVTSTETEPTTATIVFKPTFYYDFERTYRTMIHPVTGESMRIVDKMLIVSFKNAPEMTDPLPDGKTVPPIGDPNFAVNDPDVRAFINQAGIRVMYLLPALKTLFVTPESLTVEEAITQWPTKFSQIEAVEPSKGGFVQQSIALSGYYKFCDKPSSNFPRYSTFNYHWNLWDKNKWGFEVDTDYKSTWDKYDDQVGEKIFFGVGAKVAWNLYPKPAWKSTIAVIDSGVQRSHIDLKDNLCEMGVNVVGDLPLIYFSKSSTSSLPNLPYGPAGDIWKPTNPVQSSINPNDDLKIAYDKWVTPNIAHGTNCAGIISAVVGNVNSDNERIGVAGASYNQQILPIAMSQDWDVGYGYFEDKIVQSIYAVGVLNGTFSPPNLYPVVSKDFIIPEEANLYQYPNFSLIGLKVVSLSISSIDEKDPLKDPFDKVTKEAFRLLSKTTIIVCSAGNQYLDTSGYPAKYSYEFRALAPFNKKYENCNILSVGATDYFGYQAIWDMDLKTKEISSASNYGKTVDVSAPGYEILTTDLTVNDYGWDIGKSSKLLGAGLTNWEFFWKQSYPEKLDSLCPYLSKNYSFFEGTSAATPHVAALAGILYNIKSNSRPTELVEIVSRIKDTAISPPNPVGIRKIMPNVVNFKNAINGFK